MLDAKPSRLANLRSGSVDAQFAQALALNRQGQLREAELLCDEIVRRAPSHFDALNFLGALALRSRRYRRAAALLARAVAVHPVMAGTHNNLGLALAHLRRWGEALQSYDKAIALKPQFALAHLNRANALRSLKRPHEALASYDKAISLEPDLQRAHTGRGHVLHVLERFEDALQSYDRAISLAPDIAACHADRGKMLHNLERLDEAVESYDRAIAMKPDDAQAHLLRGHALRGLQKLDQAIASYDEAFARNPELALARLSRGNCLLLQGNFGEGLQAFEQRFSHAASSKRRTYSQPLWQGDADIAGKTLFIYPELYLGDMIQFCRYAKIAEAHGAKVVLSAQQSLHTLLAGLSPSIEIIGEDEQPAHFDMHCPIMSLPYAFKTKEATIPAAVPYLSADVERVESWKERLGETGIRIGICWRGSRSAYAKRLQRSFPLSLFHQISELPNIRLISLQKNDGEEAPEDANANVPVESLGDAFDAGPQAFLDSAAVMQSLDLIITTDTSIAHLAGALARPTWLVLKHVPDWRWMLDRPNSPWYPTMRLFRQKRRGDWQSAFDEMEAALRTEFTSTNN